MVEETEEPGHGIGTKVADGGGAPSGRSTVQLERDGKGEAGRDQSKQGRGTAAETKQEARTLSIYEPKRDFQREAALIRNDPWRNHPSIDWARIIHSPSFRRLQGKTQVFPGHESDFFRNRLTHSLEVAQIAEGIADKINHDNKDLLRGQLVDPRLCASAALMHDLGHPPFGHNGERALDDMMQKYGGFEGNAQSLRIIARLEKKLTGPRSASIDPERDDNDKRVGLNLTYRSLASILKYDNEILHVRPKQSKLQKGYYGSERHLVARIKAAVAPNWREKGKFKTIECSIMDLADDIAYSTYDLEDCFKAGFLSPAKIMATSERVLSNVASKVSKELGEKYDGKRILEVFDKVFKDIIDPECFEADNDDDVEEEVRLHRLTQFADYFTASSVLIEDGARRSDFSSRLVSFAIRNIEMRPNYDNPALSEVHLSPEARERVEVLKQYTYTTTIDSPRVKVAEFRGYEVVRDIFKALASEKGKVLMPDDVRALFDEAGDDISLQRRAICDFVAGMTDRYAIEFYARLHSDSAQSMFKPL